MDDELSVFFIIPSLHCAGSWFTALNRCLFFPFLSPPSLLSHLLWLCNRVWKCLWSRRVWLTFESRCLNFWCLAVWKKMSLGYLELNILVLCLKFRTDGECMLPVVSVSTFSCTLFRIDMPPFRLSYLDACHIFHRAYAVLGDVD